MDRTDLLRTTYRINAVATFACGAVLLAAGHLLADPFAVPVAALRLTGVVFVLLALWVWTLSRRAQLLWGEAAILGVLDGVYALASLAALIDFWSLMTPELRIAVAMVGAPVAIFASVELSSALRLRASAGGLVRG